MEGEAPVAEPPRAAPSAEHAGGDENDIAPEHAVTKLVHKERRERPKSNDLLDASRPQE